MSAPVIQGAFTAGELAPSMFGHIDQSRYHSGTATMRNCFVGYRGGAHSRPGTAFVGYSVQPTGVGRLGRPKLIRFQFNIRQGYALEFGNHYVRFIFGGGYVLESGIAITNALQGTSTAIGAPGHGFVNGDWVVISGVSGMTQLNGRTFRVINAATNSFEIERILGGFVNSLVYNAYTSGGTASRIYTLYSPYVVADVAKLKTAQSADVMSITHPDYPPYELSRLGPTSWTLAPASFGTAIVAPGAITATATNNPSSSTSPPTLPCAYAFVVTAVDAETGQESVASTVASVTDSVNMSVTAGSIDVVWSSITGATSYNIYRAPPSYNTNTGSTTNALPVPVGALFGYVATAFGTEFIDSNSSPDYTHTPPLHRDPFAPGPILEIPISSSSTDWTLATVTITTLTGSGFVGEVVISGGAVTAILIRNAGREYLSGDAAVITGDGSSVTSTLKVGAQTGTYPGVVSYYQQRRVYAATLSRPDTFWLSQPGAFTNFDTSIPTIDSDAISGTPWAEQVNGIQWAVSMPLGLVMFTGGGVWQVAASQTSFANPGALTPANEIATPLTSIGCSENVPPIRINNDVIYLQSKGSTIRDLSYQIYFQYYTATDISWQSSHLLEGHEIVSWAWCEEPYRVLWATRDDGMLLSLTYVKEQEVAGLARHDTQGMWRDVCSVTEGNVDALYLVAERVNGYGVSYYAIERMDDRLWGSVEDCWCVDAAVAAPLDQPDADLWASSSIGPVTFAVNADVFFPSGIGTVLRMGGGIAVISGYTSPRIITGSWVKPPRELTPNDPLKVPLPQGAGRWSLASPFTVLGGLDHLANQQVVGLLDGIPTVGIAVNADGFVTLPFAASRVILGLGFTAQIQSLYLDTGSPTIQGRRKAVYAVTTRLQASGTPEVGANQVDSSALTPASLYEDWTISSNQSPAAPVATYQSVAGATVTELYTGDIRAVIPAAWKRPAQIAVQQKLPLPIALVALVPEIIPGDEPEIGLSQRQTGGLSRASAQRQPG